MGTKPKVILRRKKFGISKIFTPKMTKKVKIMLMQKNPCARSYPRKHILKIQDNLFCLFGEK